MCIEKAHVLWDSTLKQELKSSVNIAVSPMMARLQIWWFLKPEIICHYTLKHCPMEDLNEM